MGDGADYAFESGLSARLAHLRGECQGPCEDCDADAVQLSECCAAEIGYELCGRKRHDGIWIDEHGKAHCGVCNRYLRLVCLDCGQPPAPAVEADND